MTIDPVRCQRSGVCAGIAPEAFDLGEEGPAVVQGELAPGLDRAVRDAARRCPTRAITVSG